MDQLNERQIDICEQMGLPTDFDSLTTLQQMHIQRIEELLEHLEKTYSTEFFYLGYSDEIVSDEWLEAYSSKTSELYPTRLVVDKSGNMHDNYCEVIASIILKDNLEQYLNNSLSGDFKVFASDCYLKRRFEANTMKELISNASGTFTIFVKGKNHYDKLKEYADALYDWYKKNQIFGYSNFIMVSDDYFEALNETNYKHAKLEDKTEISFSCDLSEDGILTIY